MFADTLVLVRGGGDLGSGVVHRLYRAGFDVWVTDIAQPLAVRRGVAFAEAVYTGETTVEGVCARRAIDRAAAQACRGEQRVPVLVDEGQAWLTMLQPAVVVDARMQKTAAEAQRAPGRLVIGLGPGFEAGQNCDAVVETMRGHHLGRVFWEGQAEPDTGRPEEVRGLAGTRVLRAPTAGVLTAGQPIGSAVRAGDVVAQVGGQAVTTPIDGVLRGMLHDGVPATAGLKIGDVDPRGVRAYCFSISDKARAVGGGVLEAILAGQARWQPGAGGQ